MKRIALAALLLLALSNAALAVAPTSASLKGPYMFQISSTYQVSWSKTVSATCFGVKYTWTGVGQGMTTHVLNGVFTFSGAGTVTVDYEADGVFEQQASDNTVTIACTNNPSQPYVESSGHAVIGGSSGSDSGTYVVGANPGGTGFGGNLSLVKNGDIGFLLAGLNSSDLASTLLLRMGGSVQATGIAVHQ